MVGRGGQTLQVDGCQHVGGAAHQSWGTCRVVAADNLHALQLIGWF